MQKIQYTLTGGGHPGSNIHFVGCKHLRKRDGIDRQRWQINTKHSLTSSKLCDLYQSYFYSKKLHLWPRSRLQKLSFRLRLGTSFSLKPRKTIKWIKATLKKRHLNQSIRFFQIKRQSWVKVCKSLRSCSSICFRAISYASAARFWPPPSVGGLIPVCRQTEFPPGANMQQTLKLTSVTLGSKQQCHDSVHN